MWLFPFYSFLSGLIIIYCIALVWSARSWKRFNKGYATNIAYAIWFLGPVQTEMEISFAVLNLNRYGLTFCYILSDNLRSANLLALCYSISWPFSETGGFKRWTIDGQLLFVEQMVSEKPQNDSQKNISLVNHSSTFFRTIRVVTHDDNIYLVHRLNHSFMVHSWTV